jgi:hypothetical protein
VTAGESNGDGGQPDRPGDQSGVGSRVEQARPAGSQSSSRLVSSPTPGTTMAT